MSGLYTSPSEDSFKSQEEIAADLTKKPVITFDRPNGVEAERWFSEGRNRQELRAEIEDSYDYAKIEIEADRPVAIGITGDWHLGATVNLDLLKRDVDVIANHPLVRGCFFTGDLTDSANFNPAQDEDFFNLEEQRAWMLAALDMIGKDRILAMWKGNHDHKWEAKNGTSKYTGLAERYGAPIFYGNAYVDLFINDINYRLMGSHRARGNSIYTNAHPSMRSHRETQGLDIAFCGHTHKKGIVEQSVREFNGARKIFALVNGTYQYGSGYTKDSGFGNQTNEEQGMWWIILNHDRKMVRICDTEAMVETMDQYLR